MTTIRFFGDHRCDLGESPLWDPLAQRLWFIDAHAGAIHIADPEGAIVSTWRYGQVIGSIGLAAGGVVATMPDGLYRIDETTGASMPIASVPPADPRLRFNDGKADRHGRFLSGQMMIGADPEAPPLGGFYRFDRDGHAECLIHGIRLTNATCFSPDGTTLYMADSLEGVIRAYPYDGATGAIGARRDLVDCRVHGSPPDGATVDAEGRLWVALVLAQAIACYAPDGTLLDRIDTPIPFPSCPAFGGADMATLFVTSIANSGHRLVTDHPDGGRLLAITGHGARGLAEGRYNHIPD